MRIISKQTVFFILGTAFLFLINPSGGMAGPRCLCPTVTADPHISEGWYLAWDLDNPDEIDPDDSKFIRIEGSRPPFTWTVNGEDFVLEREGVETRELFNILHAGVDACGAAEITVTDKYGTSITGYVRCSNGKWTTCCWSSGYNGTEAYVYITTSCRWRFDLRHWGQTTFCCDPNAHCPGVITFCPESCVYLPDYFYPTAKSQKFKYQVWQCP